MKTDDYEISLVDGQNWDGLDLGPLQATTSPHSISLVSYKKLDLSSAILPASIKRLRIVSSGPNKINFGPLTSLESASFRWHKSSADIFNIKSLKECTIFDYPEDCFPSIDWPELRTLKLFNAKVRSLRGLEHAPQLTYLRLVMLGRLGDISTLTRLKYLRTLYIQQCRGFGDLEPISKMESLEELILDCVKEVPTIGPIKDLHMLRKFVFLGSTFIGDGDLSYLDGLSRLECVSFRDRKQYNRKRNQFPQMCP